MVVQYVGKEDRAEIASVVSLRARLADMSDRPEVGLHLMVLATHMFRYGAIGLV